MIRVRTVALIAPLSLASLSAISSSARADGTPIACPAGSVVTVLRDATFCAPQKRPCVPGSHWEVFGPEQAFCVQDPLCTPDVACDGTRSCASAPHCVSEAHPRPTEASFAVSRVIEGCGAESSCPAGSTCKVVSVCLEDPEKIEAKRSEEEAKKRAQEHELIKTRLREHEAGNNRAMKAASLVVAFVLSVAALVGWLTFRPKK
jgi:hypothetical protein